MAKKTRPKSSKSSMTVKSVKGLKGGKKKCKGKKKKKMLRNKMETAPIHGMLKDLSQSINIFDVAKINENFLKM